MGQENKPRDYTTATVTLTAYCPGCHKDLLQDQYETTKSIWCKNCWEERKADVIQAIEIMKANYAVELEQEERFKIWRTK